MGSGARIGMEQAKASATNSDEASVAAQAPYGVVTLRSGYWLGRRKRSDDGADSDETGRAPNQSRPRPDAA